MTPTARDRAATWVRDRIEDGTLGRGEYAPTAPALSAATGVGISSCRRALADLTREGILVRAPGPNCHPRVAGGTIVPAPICGRLAALRREAGLSAEELAALAGFSVTTIWHAESGRLWQSRRFWERTDDALGAGGELVRLHVAYCAGTAPPP